MEYYDKPKAMELISRYEYFKECDIHFYNNCIEFNYYGTKFDDSKETIQIYMGDEVLKLDIDECSFDLIKQLDLLLQELKEVIYGGSQMD